MKRTYILSTVLAFALLFTAISCSDDHHDHGEVPVGFQLTLNGDMLVNQDHSTVTYATGNAIEIPANDVVGPIQLQFLAEDGDLYTPDGHGDEYFLNYSLSNPSVVSVEHPVDGSEWRFNISGQTEGSTTITFELMHVDHSDFESLPINITVFERDEAVE